MPLPSSLRRMKLALAVGLCALGLGGCVGQQPYDELRVENQALKARNQELLDANRALEDANRQLNSRGLGSAATLDEANRLIGDLRTQLARANDRIRSLDDQLRNLDIGRLDPETDAALQELASKYPNILSYDSERGMLRFTSDVTFASGSFDLTDGARRTIADLARILREVPSAGQYDIRVVGHTDTQRVSQRAGRRFINNRELSAFRSISVMNELATNGIAAGKIEIAGWGEDRPAQASGPNANVPGNRRVEVFLTRGAGAARSDSGSSRRSDTGAGDPAPRGTPRNDDMMK